MTLFGAGGHGKVIADILSLTTDEEIIFFDNNTAASIAGYRVVNTLMETRGTDSVIVAVGNNLARKNIAASLKARFATAIHPRSCLAKNVLIGDGTVVMAGAIVNPFSIIGHHCILNTASSVDHDCIIEDYAHISPGTVLCGGIHVGEGAHICAGAVVAPNMKIGKWAVVGAGSVVLADIPDYAVAVGSPAKVIKFNYPEL